MAKTANQLMRRKHITTPFGEAPKGFKRHNFLLVTGNEHTNLWVRSTPGDRKDGTIKEWSK